MCTHLPPHIGHTDSEGSGWSGTFCIGDLAGIGVLTGLCLKVLISFFLTVLVGVLICRCLDDKFSHSDLDLFGVDIMLACSRLKNHNAESRVMLH